MYHSESSTGRKMGMCIAITWLAVCGPTGMSHSRICMEVISYYTFLKCGYPTLFFINAQIFIQQSHSGAVVSAIFQSFESLHYNRIRFPRTYICNYSTHVKFLN